MDKPPSGLPRRGEGAMGRVRINPWRVSTPHKAGLCAETYRTWLPPRLTAWAGKSERRGAAQNLARSARGDTGFIGSRAVRRALLSRLGGDNFSQPQASAWGVSPRAWQLTQPRLARGGYTPTPAYQPRSLSPIAAYQLRPAKKIGTHGDE